MKSIQEIIALGFAKISEAELLNNNGFHDTAFYLGGYSVELFLKARVCKTLNIPDFFDDETKSQRKVSHTTKAKDKQQENLYKPFKVHDYEQLIILCGLFADIQAKLSGDKMFRIDWSIVTTWSEQSRYETGKSQKDVQQFIAALKNIATWIQQFL